MNIARPLRDDSGMVAEDDPLPPDDRVTSKSRRTLDDLYRTQGPRLRRFFSRKAGPVEADDLVHETFARFAGRNEHGLEQVVEPEAYLSTVATNLLRNRAKLAVRRAAIHHQVFDDGLVSGPDPTLQLESRDELRRLDAAVQRLRPRMREVFLLKRVEGMTYIQIAERVGMSVKGVKKQMAKALCELRRDVGAAAMIWSFAVGRSRRIARQADRWHAEMEEPSSHAQIEAFEAWLKADPAHLKAYRESEAIAEAGTRLMSPSHLSASSFAMARGYRPAFAIAASVAFAIVLWSLIRVPAPAYAAVFNRGQATRVVALRDGSIVTLDTATALEVAVAPGSHHVKMVSGRARFAVRLSRDGPLKVTAAAGEVTSANGIFDIAVVNDDVRVWVISGEVDVAVRAARAPVVPLVLTSGNGVRVAGGAAETSIERPDTGWPVAHVAFDQKPLADILAIANRTGEPDIVVSDDAVGRLRVTGVLDLRDARKLVRKLAAALDLKVTERNGSLLLSR